MELSGALIVKRKKHCLDQQWMKLITQIAIERRKDASSPTFKVILHGYLPTELAVKELKNLVISPSKLVVNTLRERAHNFKYTSIQWRRDRNHVFFLLVAFPNYKIIDVFIRLLAFQPFSLNNVQQKTSQQPAMIHLNRIHIRRHQPRFLFLNKKYHYGNNLNLIVYYLRIPKSGREKSYRSTCLWTTLLSRSRYALMRLPALSRQPGKKFTNCSCWLYGIAHRLSSKREAYGY